MIQVTSKDLARVIKAHKRFPWLLQKTFPATAREETKGWRSSIRRGIIAANWPRDFKMGGKDINLTSVRTSKFKEFKEVGISIKPRAQGPSVLFEKGSKGIRKKKSGASTGILHAKPVYSPEWEAFKNPGKNTIRSSFLKASMKVMERELRKKGVKR